MQNFINTIVKYKEILTFTTLVVISLSMISSGSVSEIGGFRTLIVGTLGSLQNAFSWIPNPGSMKSENKALRELNAELSTEVIRMREASLENERLRNMLRVRDNDEYELIAAEVVGKSVIELRNYLTINKGKNQGVQRGMAARTDAGLVGLVIAANTNYSMIEMLTNRNVRVSAKIQESGYDGILSWAGGTDFFLERIPKRHKVSRGEMLITSNLSNRFPPNIPIGRVADVQDDKTTLFLSIRIRPFVNFASLEEVFIVKFLPDPQRIKLLEEVEERLRLRKEMD